MSEEKTFTLPDYMVEKLEENLKLFLEDGELRGKLRPTRTAFLERLSKKSHEEKLKHVLWHALCAHEDELKERIERNEIRVAVMGKGD